MTAETARLADVLDEAGIDTESLTVVLVSGATEAELSGALGLDLAAGPLPDDEGHDQVETTAYAVRTIAGGALALELSGYGDPTLDALRSLSGGGRVAAVARANIQAHDRFGYARDGEVVFDSDEYLYVEELDDVPAEVRDLAALVHDDDDAEEDPFLVALAMAERVTGLQVGAADVPRVGEGEWWSAASLVYAPEA